MKFEELKFESHQMTIGLNLKQNNDFKEYLIKEGWDKLLQANYMREDGVSFSIIFGKPFYSNGVDTYEILASKEDEPEGYLSKDEIEKYINNYKEN